MYNIRKTSMNNKQFDGNTIAQFAHIWLDLRVEAEKSLAAVAIDTSVYTNI